MSRLGEGTNDGLEVLGGGPTLAGIILGAITVFILGVAVMLLACARYAEVKPHPVEIGHGAAAEAAE